MTRGGLSDDDGPLKICRILILELRANIELSLKERKNETASFLFAICLYQYLKSKVTWQLYIWIVKQKVVKIQ